MGRHLRATAPRLVLCHADLHTANLLLNAAGGVWIVDWDQTILAPPERDLMFVVGGVAEAEFYQGYGSGRADPLALAYYHYEWAIQEVGDYGQRVISGAGLSREVRREALVSLEALFE